MISWAGGTSTVGGAVVPAPDAINKMRAGCDVAAETAFLTKVLLPNTGIRVLIGKPCPGTTNDVLWRRIASYPCCGDPSDGIAPMLFTLGGDPSEHPTNLVGAWLKFSPDNFRGGFYMGQAACKASGDQKNMPILFLKGPEPLAPWCGQSKHCLPLTCNNHCQVRASLPGLHKRNWHMCRALELHCGCS